MAHGRPESSSGLVRPRSFRGRRCRGHEPTRETAGWSAARSVYPTSPVRGNQTADRAKHRPKHRPEPVDSCLPRAGRLSGDTRQEVVNVAGAVRNRQHANILNSDGRPHPVENILTIFTLVVGLVSFVLGLIVRNVHTGAAVIVIATATGLVACLVGLYVQLVSSTREQRILIVTGIIAGFVGLALGLSKGGFIA